MGKLNELVQKNGKTTNNGSKKDQGGYCQSCFCLKERWKEEMVKGNNKVFMDEATDKAMRKDVTNMSLITISTLSEKYKIIGSLCRPLIKQFAAEGKIVPIGNQHSTLVMYTGTGYLAKKAGNA